MAVVDAAVRRLDELRSSEPQQGGEPEAGLAEVARRLPEPVVANTAVDRYGRLAGGREFWTQQATGGQDRGAAHPRSFFGNNTN